ncbi:hypothetical protein BJY24_005846 [Nocardia transvalensis]|uniref:Uncharacterized protein n=1 Tax=Nocardia transvalensis TaxID=37333 RepID=A0A7W9PJU9_9NOCA|nr:hypothetical protein [Nocardia transvalensis]MBB5916934.1 hypothetical protein [Nocardia transvalensis]
MMVDRDPGRERAVADRAARAGYRLVRGPGDWVLVDAADGVALHAAASLDLIERWLSE